jgi:hypothetical protein
MRDDRLPGLLGFGWVTLKLKVVGVNRASLSEEAPSYVRGVELQ